MEADKKTFIDIDTFISNIETLINQGISEITKGGQMFKVNSTWYIVYYDNNYGMNINLESGADRNNIDTYLYSAWNVGAHSEERNKTDKLFEKLHEIYVLHQLFNKTNIIKSLKNMLIYLKDVHHLKSYPKVHLCYTSIISNIALLEKKDTIQYATV